MAGYRRDAVLNYIVKSFAETVSLKVSQLRSFVPKQKSKTNSALTGAFVEELVRGFVKNWIGQKQILQGTFYFDELKTNLDKLFAYGKAQKKLKKSRNRPLQIDGIIYDPTRGPLTLYEGNFGIVHPAFCPGIIEIKTSIASIDSLEHDLREYHTRYLSHVPAANVLGVVIADSTPEKTSECPLLHGKNAKYHNYTCGICPIFILFEETANGEYKPYNPGISGLIHCIYRNINSNLLPECL